MIIAVDGPAAAGKGTLAKGLAKSLNFAHLDSGTLYRAVAFAMLKDRADPSDRESAIAASRDLDVGLIDLPEIRGEDVGKLASSIAKIPELRANLLDFQRNFAHRPPGGAAGAVIDGRDIGTVVCPEAEVKFFVTASDEARARRRALELEGRGSSYDLETVRADLAERDAQDRNRTAAPLKPAPDAHLLDTTELDIEAALARALEIVAQARGR